MQIDKNLIAYLEDLSCLNFSDEESQKLPEDLKKILGYMAQLGALDTEGVPERSHPFDKVNVFREDIRAASFPREHILKNAPDRNDEMFIAPNPM